MLLPKDLQLQPASYLLLVLLYESNLPSTKLSAEQYLKDNKSHIEATCRVLELLQLAKPAQQSALGWKATNLLVDLIVKPRKRLGRSAKDCIESWEENAVKMIIDAALENRDGVTPECLWYISSFFGSIGLMNINESGDWIPTRKLLNLAAESRFEKERKRDRKLFAGAENEAGDIDEFDEYGLPCVI